MRRKIIKKIYKNIIFSFIVGISIFFIGSLVIFSIFHLLPGDPVIAYLAALGYPNPSPALIAVWEHKLGLDGPLIIQYFKFLGNFFTANWGESVSVARGVKVLYLIKDSRIFIMALPVFVLTLTSIALITWQARSYLLNKSRKKSIILNTAISGTTFGFIFMFVILIETTFGHDGMGRLLIDAMDQLDYWLITGVLFVILIMFAIISLISNLLFSLYKFYVEKSSSYNLNNPAKGDDR